jgi:hypothetical protein
MRLRLSEVAAAISRQTDAVTSCRVLKKEILLSDTNLRSAGSASDKYSRRFVELLSHADYSVVEFV